MMANFKTLLSLSLLASSLMVTGACTAELGGTGVAPDARDVGPFPDGPPAQVCDEAVQIRFEQRKLTPDIMIVLDRSGSMGRQLTNNNSTSKWDVIRPALTNILIATETSVNYGLMLFPSNNDCARGTVRAAPTLNNGASILDIVNGSGSGPNNGGTPTHQSLDEVRTYYSNITPNPDGRVVLLATDGLPTCGSNTGKAVNSINALSNQGISTYVLGFGFGDVDVSGLQQMANAGGTNQVYSADSPQQLQIALDAILGDITVPSCEFQLQETPSSEADINITFNGVDLVRDDPNGWSYDSATKTISLLGASCDSVQNGGGDGIEVDLGCTGAIVD